MSEIKRLEFALGQLRHAYVHLIQGTVGNQKMFADGLLSPSIVAFERLLADFDRLQQERDTLARRVAELEQSQQVEERVRRQLFSDGVDVARQYGDNAFHLYGEQLLRHYRVAMDRIERGQFNVQPVAIPAPPVRD